MHSSPRGGQAATLLRKIPVKLAGGERTILLAATSEGNMRCQNSLFPGKNKEKARHRRSDTGPNHRKYRIVSLRAGPQPSKSVPLARRLQSVPPPARP